MIEIASFTVRPISVNLRSLSSPRRNERSEFPSDSRQWCMKLKRPSRPALSSFGLGKCCAMHEWLFCEAASRHVAREPTAALGR